MEIEIIQANLDDLYLLMEWRIRVLREVFSIPEDTDAAPLEQANRQYYERHLQEKSHMACFAKDIETGEIIGCGGMCLYQEMPSPDNPRGGCAYLMNIYTCPEFRGQGVGRKIVGWLIQQAEKKGITKIYLETSVSGRSLYQEMGFSDMHSYMQYNALANTDLNM